MPEVNIEVGATYTAHVSAGMHSFIVDESAKNGGHDEGPEPDDLLLSALGCCMSITVRMYANRKGWPLEKVFVKLNRMPDKDSRAHIQTEITFQGNLDEEMIQRLMQIAVRCPMHKTLSAGVNIETTLKK